MSTLVQNDAPSGERVYGEGPAPALCALFGERPGKMEWRLKRPFMGDSGEEVNRLLNLISISRERCWVSNIVKDFRADEEGEPLPPTPAEVKRDEPLLLSELGRVRPAFILAIGAWATRWFLGSDSVLEVVHGVPHEVELGYGPVVVVPSYHPAAAMRRTELGPLVQSDFITFGDVVRGKVQVPRDECPETEYNELCGVAVDSYGDTAIDTEGSVRHPWCLTFSTTVGEAWCVRPSSGTAFFKTGGVTILHNSMHDLGVLRAMGIELDQGQFTDTMVMAYMLQTEPQALKALALRYNGRKRLEYEELLHEANQAKAWDYIHKVSQREWPAPEPYVVHEWKKNGNGKMEYVARVRKPHGLNRLLDSLIRDIPKGVDPRDRWKKYDDSVTLPVRLAMGEMPEATLDDIDEKEAIDYACADADDTLRIYPVLKQKIENMGLERALQISLDAIPMLEHMQSKGILVDPDHFSALAGRLESRMEKMRRVIQDKTGAYINPDSGDQVADLLFNQLKLTPFKNTKKGKRPATDDKSLAQLVLQHPVVKDVMDYREVSKVRSFCLLVPTYIKDDGRIHTTLRVTRIITDRVASSNPNLTAQPTHGELGIEYRKGFVAPEGRVLGTWDLDQVEMRVLAHESQCPHLCEVFNDTKPDPRTGKKRDIHSESAALMFGMDIRDVNKKLHRLPAKHAGFGVVYGLTKEGLAIRLAQLGGTKADGTLWTPDECDDIIKEWLRVNPGVKPYILRCHAEARRTGMIRDMFGRMRLLPGVFNPKAGVRSEAERQAQNWPCQAGAQGIIKLAMAQLWRWEKMLREGVDSVLQIHDELIYEFIPGMWDILNTVVVGEMSTAVRLRVPVSANGVMGPTWGDLEK